jgi:hypothetical protein
MVGSSSLETVLCCFCGQQVAVAQATTVVVHPPSADGESQSLFCHSRCLVERLDARVPHHPALNNAV